MDTCQLVRKLAKKLMYGIEIWPTRTKLWWNGPSGWFSFRIITDDSHHHQTRWPPSADFFEIGPYMGDIFKNFLV